MDRNQSRKVRRRARHVIVGTTTALLALATATAHAQLADAGAREAAPVGLPAAVPPTPVSMPATTQPTTSFTISAGEYKHLERQAEVALARVGPALDASPPALGTVPTDRALALNLLDVVLHDPAAPQRPAVGAFRLARTKRALADMRATVVTGDGAVVWQVYNMGFVVRTRSVTMGFDLVKLTHVPAVALDDETMKAVVDQCDVLFVSHEHLDHSDREVSQFALDAGKPVLAPPTMWKGEPIHARHARLPRDGKPEGYDLPLREGQASLKVTVLPGYQRTKGGEDVENNVYVVTTPEGIRIAHTGDNNVRGGLPPSGTSGAPVDLLLMKLEPGNLKSRDIARAFDPHVTFPSHFEELGHVNVNGREPYWRGMERSAKLNVPTVIMTWGERFDYVPKR